MPDPCLWDLNFTECGLEATDSASAALIERLTAQVGTMMHTWSGHRYGGCRKVRPLDPCGECYTGCCAQGDAIVLHGASGVVSVHVDGTLLDPTAYTFDAARGVLYRADGIRWPNRDVRSDPVPALEVVVQVGEVPDAWALAVASELACELALSAQGKKCRLPKNATTVTAQGVTIALDVSELRFLIPAVATWVGAMNPHGAVIHSRVFSPEADVRRVVGRSGTPWRR